MVHSIVQIRPGGRGVSSESSDLGRPGQNWAYLNRRRTLVLVTPISVSGTRLVCAGTILCSLNSDLC